MPACWDRRQFALPRERCRGFHPAVSRSRVFLTCWLPVLAWMALIFIVSSRVGSTENTSRFLEPLLRWLNPLISDPTIHRVQVVIRKAGHLTEYAVLALLLWRARRAGRTNNPQSWNGKDATWAIVIAVLYAMTDELHQSFVPSRLGSGWDVLIDGVGASLGLLAAWLWGRWRRWW